MTLFKENRSTNDVHIDDIETVMIPHIQDSCNDSPHRGYRSCNDSPDRQYRSCNDSPSKGYRIFHVTYNF